MINLCSLEEAGKKSNSIHYVLNLEVSSRDVSARLSPNILGSGVELPVDSHEAAIEDKPWEEQGNENPGKNPSLSTNGCQC